MTSNISMQCTLQHLGVDASARPCTNTEWQLPDCPLFAQEAVRTKMTMPSALYMTGCTVIPINDFHHTTTSLSLNYVHLFFLGATARNSNIDQCMKMANDM